MYLVSNSYKTAVNADTRSWQIKVDIITPFETFHLTDADIKIGSVKYEEALMDEDKFEMGGVILSDFSMALLNSNGQYDDVQFNGATVKPEIGLETSPGTYEWIPLGVFRVDTVSRPSDAIGLMSLDNLTKADTPFSNVPITFPCSALTLLTAVCAYCHLTLVTTSFMNSDYIINAKPDGDPSCRDIIYWIAQIACSWARCDRLGRLELVSIDNPGYIQEADIDGDTDDADGGNFDEYNDKIIDGGVFDPAEPVLYTNPQNRYDLKIDDDPIIITGILFETDAGIICAGSPRYPLDISGNNLIQHDETDLLYSILNKLNSFTYLPYTAPWIGDPAVQAGDLVEHTDRKGNTYRSIVSNSKYAYRGKCAICAGGTSETMIGYKDPSARRFSEIKAKIYDKQVKINLMEDALKNAVAMIAGVWGGYVINGDSLENTDYHGNVFIADNPNPDAAQKVWRFNLGGMGYSTTGINGPFTSAWTADGHIVASLVTANMVQTGLLQSLNGESWLDLDNGAFSFGNGALKWSAADGFESLSAKKLTTPGSTAYATIGDIPYNDNGSQVMVPGLQLNGIWGNDAPFLSAFFGFGLHLLAGNGMDDLFLTAGAPSLLGGTILNQIGGDETTLKLMNGGPVFEVNGDTFGETRDVTVGTTIFHFQNGLFIGIN